MSNFIIGKGFKNVKVSLPSFDVSNVSITIRSEVGNPPGHPIVPKTHITVHSGHGRKRYSFRT